MKSDQLRISALNLIKEKSKCGIVRLFYKCGLHGFKVCIIQISKGKKEKSSHDQWKNKRPEDRIKISHLDQKVIFY